MSVRAKQLDLNLMKEGCFIMTTRELKVSQLNNILPIVRETLKKEEKLKKLREEANNLKRQLNAAINLTPKNPEFKDVQKEILEDLNKCKNSIKEIQDFITASNLLFEGFSQMFNYNLLNCYQNGGVLEVSELNEDFIYEYAYLIQNTTGLTIYRLISMKPEVLDKVQSRIKSELTSRKKIRDYLKLAIYYDKML